jgi:hypothetical protein
MSDRQLTEEQFEEILFNMFNYFSDLHDDYYELEGNNVESFKEAGIMTMNSGLVVRLYNGKEYQLTIVKSN